MFQHATIGILIVNSNGTIVKSNAFAAKLFNYTTKELEGQSVDILVPDALRRGHAKHRVSYHQKPKERMMGANLDLYAKRKDGSTFPVEISLGHAAFGEEKLAIAYIIDISELKESQQKIKAYSQQLEHKVIERTKELRESEQKLKVALSKEKELGKLKSRFVSMASHEFRTPLSSILSSAELLGMYLESGRHDKCDRNINRIKNSVRNLTGILNDFLSLEKLEAGKVAVHHTSINLADYLDELTEEIKPILRPEQQLLFATNQLNTIETDPYLLKNILINLISNAIKYSPNGKDVTLSISKEKEQLLFKVIDNGIGIPDEDKQHMFTRFFRASNVENIKGTGLGLTIVKRYLDLMEGTIGFESEYGKGSTFFFYLS